MAVERVRGLPQPLDRGEVSSVGFVVLKFLLQLLNTVTHGV